MSNQTILVGKAVSSMSPPALERERIFRMLQKQGNSVEWSMSPWPRDAFVWTGTSYLLPATHGILSEGGYFVSDDYLVLVSDALQGRVTLENVAKAYDRAAVWFPAGRNRWMGGNPEPHIDLTTMLANDHLFVDMNFYARNKPAQETFERIAQEHKLTFVPYNTTLTESCRLYPLNCPVFGDTVVVNDATPNFRALLESKGIHTLGVACTELPLCMGSLRCATNVYDPALGRPPTPLR